MSEDDLLARLRAASDNEALGIGAAWALLDEAAEALDEAQRLVADHKQCADGYFDALMEVRAALTDARVLLAECRPVIERADAVFLPPKGTCTWGPAERDALLARIDALVQP
jgi:hypothetical protein